MQLTFAERPAALTTKGINDNKSIKSIESSTPEQLSVSVGRGMGPVRWLCVLNKALSLHKDEERAIHPSAQ